MKTVVVAISGGIAAYKSAEVVSRLKKNGFCVHCIMTKNACEFIAPLTLETLSGNPVITDMFDREVPWEVEHVSLAKKADVFVIAPATANVLGKITAGIADDMLTTTAMATSAKILIAPAMNNGMYKSIAMQENLKTLAKRGVFFVGPESGFLACGDMDIGRMSEPAKIVEHTINLLSMSEKLHGKKVIITAGPTKEKIDPVRFITNHSTGKMGYAIAEAALDAGANVTLITGPTSVMPPSGANVIDINSTNEMREAVVSRFDDCDAVIAAAAPSDFRPKVENVQKIKKNNGMTLELVSNPDIAVEIGKIKKHQKIIIFAAESENLFDNAKDKLQRKNADLIVANDITQDGAGFAGDTNIASIIDKDGNIKNYKKMQKRELAHIIIDELTLLLNN